MRRSGFLRKGFYPKSEVQWKLHQEGDAGNNLSYKNSPAIPEASLDEHICAPNPIHIVPTPTYVGILVLQCCWNVRSAGSQADLKNILSDIECLY